MSELTVQELPDGRPAAVTPENLSALTDDGWAWCSNLEWPLSTPLAITGLEGMTTVADLLRETRKEFGEENVLLGVPINPQTFLPDWGFGPGEGLSLQIGVYIRCDED